MELHDWTARVNALSTGYKQSQILFAAVEAGLFSLLEEERDAEEIAKEVGWHPRGARMLLDGLVALELIEKQAGTTAGPARYRNAPIASACLVPGRRGYQGHIIKHQENSWETWGRIEECLRSGTCVDSARRERDSEALRAFILGMSDTARISAEDMLRLLDLSNYERLLDVGGGPATYSIAFLETYPTMRATLFDLPDVVEIAQEEVALAGLTGRFSFVCGDFLTDDLGHGYDLVLVSNIIHSLSPNENRTLLKKCCDAMVSGGLLIVKDFLTDPERTGPPFALLFALQMLLHTPAGDTYSTAQVEAWTREAGFSQGGLIDLTPHSRLWLADKP